jgi:hypothetical protein
MEFADALRAGASLQIYLPDRLKPLHVRARPVAEAFLVSTDHGDAVVWLDPYWCDLNRDVCHLAYATPEARANGERWVEKNPRFGPRCIAYLKPVVFERLDRNSANWNEFERWWRWRTAKGRTCDRDAAWQRVQSELSDINPRRLA